MALPRCVLMNCCIIPLPVVLSVLVILTSYSYPGDYNSYLTDRSFAAITPKLSRSYGISYRLPFDKITRSVDS